MVKPTPSTKYLDPRREPTKWLGAILIDLLEQDTEESKEALKWAFPRMAQWLEPGIIDQLFVPWIDQYMELWLKTKTIKIARPRNLNQRIRRN